MTGPETRTPGATPANAHSANHEHDEATARQAVAQADKRIATVLARGALAGVVIHVTSAPGRGCEFTALRWQCSRTFDTLADLEQWLDRIEGKRP